MQSGKARTRKWLLEYEPEVARHCLEAVARQIASGKVVAPHRVHGVDRLAPGDRVARALQPIRELAALGLAKARAARRRPKR